MPKLFAQDPEENKNLVKSYLIFRKKPFGHAEGRFNKLAEKKFAKRPKFIGSLSEI